MKHQLCAVISSSFGLANNACQKSSGKFLIAYNADFLSQHPFHSVGVILKLWLLNERKYAKTYEIPGSLQNISTFCSGHARK